MYFNIILDFAVGLVPFVGDIADAAFRANTRNCWALEQYLKRKAESERTGHANIVAEAEGLPAQPQMTQQKSGGWRQALFGSGSPPPADEEMAVRPSNTRPQSEGITSNGRSNGNGRAATRPQR